jgi:hypothetical protein
MISLVFFIEKREKKNSKRRSHSEYSSPENDTLIKIRNYINIAKKEKSESCRLLKCPECPRKIHTAYRLMCHLKTHVNYLLILLV